MLTITLGILTTTAHHIHGRTVREYLGLVSGDTVVVLQHRQRRGARDERDGFDLQRARQCVLATMARRAGERGATVVLAVTIDYVALGVGRLLVTATGTAARL
ncbi:MAG: hypothetical protein DCC58_13515 [Chloroflexi bacterium]|nr:MAG: hypothetical protein DCC58_13515 [Chloroflexota bacterium]